MTAANFDLFEMRRLESLSNTIFGVAMTLLAYDLPKAGQFTSPPGWADLYHLYSGRVVALMPSFIIAGVFWISHHRGLMRQPLCGRGRSCRRAGRGMSGRQAGRFIRACLYPSSGSLCPGGKARSGGFRRPRSD
jgi:hypothetical protein